jgi:2-polyprenyl-3-methyl-5-hydroxy-6-metoxy-1,4-benzoquinol methylase
MQEHSAKMQTEKKDGEKKSHWENIYATKGAPHVSWYAPHLELSLQLIKQTGVNTAGQIIDAGGGASTLVDDLLEQGYQNISILDIASTALGVSQARLGSQANDVRWIEGDVTRIALAQNFFDVWHDRAVFHFLTEAQDRRRYLDLVKSSLKPEAHLILATFAQDGPAKCSGLEVVRYSIENLTAELGEGFELIKSLNGVHTTPFHTEQKFLYSHFRKRH